MLPKSYLIAKWTVYALATLALAAVQHLVLGQISVLGVTPFLYPMLPALVASYEGLQRGSRFSLVMGFVCDLLLFAPFPGFYTITFTLIGVLAGLIGENLLSPGWLCGFTVSAMGLAIGAIISVIVAIFTNLYIIFPFYIKLYGMNWDGIVAMFSAVNPWIHSVPTMVAFSVVPFNLISRTITAVLAFVTYKKLSVPLKKMIQ